jgi:hypothetical protein
VVVNIECESVDKLTDSSLFFVFIVIDATSLSRGTIMTSFTSLSALSMGIDDFIGTPVQQEGGFFDPLNLSDGKDEDTLRWYRAAELKHGRVCMLATLGVVVQGLGASLPNPIFQETNAFKAVGAIYEASPIAIWQILISISAVEVLCASIEPQFERPGDFGWDPLNIRPKDEAQLDDLQLKELKNGRLAMLSFAGMSYQAYLTGQGTIEQLSSGHISPFGDGQGIF